MIIDTITMTAMGGAVLALVQWLSILLLTDFQIVPVGDDVDQEM